MARLNRTAPRIDAAAQTIETEHLFMRRPTKADFEPWCAFMDDGEAAKYIGGRMTPSQCWRGLMTMAGSWELEGFAMFSLIEKATGEWVGRVGPWRPHDWPGPEVGWGVIPSRWGRGYAVEAAAASMDYAADVLGWDDMIHSIHPDNTSSQRVARKLGSINRGRGKLPPPFENVQIDIWGQTAAEWKARR